MKNTRSVRFLALVAALLAMLDMSMESRAQVNMSIHVPPVGPGEIVVASLGIDRAFGLAGADFVIAVPDFVTPGQPETTSATDGFLVASSSGPGRIKVALARAQGLTEHSATLLRLPLRLASTAPAGGYVLSFKEVQLFDEQPLPMAAQADGGTLTVTPPPPDLDQDGLPDTWETQHFGNLSGHPETDSDGDGLSDRAEFMAGTVPSALESVFRISGTPALNHLGQRVTLIRWEGHEVRNYEIQWSHGPISSQMVWHPVYNPSIRKEGSWFSWIDDGSRTHATVQDTPERFYRVVLVP